MSSKQKSHPSLPAGTPAGLDPGSKTYFPDIHRSLPAEQAGRLSKR